MPGGLASAIEEGQFLFAQSAAGKTQVDVVLEGDDVENSVPEGRYPPFHFFGDIRNCSVDQFPESAADLFLRGLLFVDVGIDLAVHDDYTGYSVFKVFFYYVQYLMSQSFVLYSTDKASQPAMIDRADLLNERH